MKVPGHLTFPISSKEAPPEPRGSYIHPSKHPQMLPPLPEAGGRACGPQGHHPNSYNQQPCQDFNSPNYPVREKHTK